MHGYSSLLKVFGILMLLVSPLSASDQQPGEALRAVSNNVVVSRDAPALAVKLDPALRYLGRHSIKIRDIAAGERLVFAETNDGKVKRMLVLQFEGFLPHVEDGQYRYDFDGRPVIAGYPFRSNPYAFDLSLSRAENPGNESSSTAEFLEGQGLTPPDIWMMWRSLTAELPERRDELIIFYVEPGADYDMGMADIYDPVTDNSTDAWREFMVGLEQRANAAYQLAPVMENGEPDRNAWRSVPLLLSTD